MRGGLDNGDGTLPSRTDRLHRWRAAPIETTAFGEGAPTIMRLAFTALSDVGRRRVANEDAVHGRLDPKDPQSALLVIADGMGGAAAGEVASRMAVETIDEVYFAARERSPEARLLAAILAANERIARAGQEEQALRGMGTTCTALAIVGANGYVGHVGDSRAYRVRGRTGITRLTRDMSAWAERVRAGGLPSSEYGRNQLLEAVGLNPNLAPEMRGGVEVAPGDRFLLCSDGLWGLVTDPEMLAIVDGAPLDEACRSLVDLANRRGGPDNVSVILAAVTD
jgi:protein phosphatase